MHFTKCFTPVLRSQKKEKRTGQTWSHLGKTVHDCKKDQDWVQQPEIQSAMFPVLLAWAATNWHFFKLVQLGGVKDTGQCSTSVLHKSEHVYLIRTNRTSPNDISHNNTPKWVSNKMWGIMCLVPPVNHIYSPGVIILYTVFGIIMFSVHVQVSSHCHCQFISMVPRSTGSYHCS